MMKDGKKMEKTVRWGIVGCGDVTETKSGPAFNKIKGSELIAVMRRSGDKAKDYAQRHNVPKWYDDADALINDPDVNAVYVATPPGSHAEFAIKAMQVGKPVYVEKPMAARYDQCEEMVRVSEQTGVPLFVAYYRRMLPGFIEVKKLIDSGSIGKPLHFFIRFFMKPRPEDYNEPAPWRVIPDLSGGGYIFDLGSHQLDFIDYVLGPLNHVSSTLQNHGNLYDVEDFVSAGFIGENGITGNGVWSFAAPDYLQEDLIEIVGDRGKISMSCFDFTQTVLSVDDINTFFDNPRPEHVQQPLIDTIVNQLLGKGNCPSTGKTAARTSKILDMIANKS
jgi:predicted dehydrogenase